MTSHLEFQISFFLVFCKRELWEWQGEIKLGESHAPITFHDSGEFSKNV